jgi:hypothetical protein
MRGLLTAAAAVALLTFVSGCGPLTSNELREEVKSLHSNAAEGALLAQQVALNKSRSTLTRVHAQELSGATSASEEKLTDAIVESEIKGDVKRALDLADASGTQLDKLATDPKNEELARDAEQKLNRISAEFSVLEERL